MATKEEILGGNKLIAEFMGWKFKTAAYNWEHSRIKNSTWTDLNKVGHYSLSFDSSWDWLMPVVEKINTIDNFEYDVVIWRSDCHINNKVEIIFESSRFKKETTLISVVWNCIILFIQWYNKISKIKNNGN